MVQFFSNNIVQSKERVSDIEKEVAVLLNKNESPFDIPSSLKQEVIKHLEQKEWNRYPSANNSVVIKLFSTAFQIDENMIALAPGAASMITALLNYFTLSNYQIVISQPSFSLYEYHCNTYNIPYDIWPLTEEFEYDNNLLPSLNEKSIVLLASPNNPIGNTLSYQQLEDLINRHPQTLFIIDEVYREFTDVNYLPLFSNSQNLILIRSLSKTLSAAGVRVGYAIAHSELILQIRKLILPFSLNHFSACFIEAALTNTAFIKYNKDCLLLIKEEKDRVFLQLSQFVQQNELYHLYKSDGNFILIRFHSSILFREITNTLIDNKVLVLDLSSSSKLKNCIRVSIGSEAENNHFLNCFKSLIV